MGDVTVGLHPGGGTAPTHFPESFFALHKAIKNLHRSIRRGFRGGERVPNGSLTWGSLYAEFMMGREGPET